MTKEDVINWWKTTTLEQREEFLTEINSDCVSPTTWYVYPCLTKEEKDQVKKEWLETFKKVG